MTSAGEVLTIVALGGILGMVGQGARAVIGLKKRSDQNKSSPGEADAFDASRLVVSLIIGFVAGVVAVFSLGLDAFTSIDIKLLLALAAAGYAGTDVIEGFLGRITSVASPKVATDLGASEPEKMLPKASLFSAAIPTTKSSAAREFVHGVLSEIDPNVDMSNDKKTPLSAFLLDDAPSKDGLATRINQRKWRSVFVDNPTIEKCMMVQDVIDAVIKKMK